MYAHTVGQKYFAATEFASCPVSRRDRSVTCPKKNQCIQEISLYCLRTEMNQAAVLQASASQSSDYGG